MKFGRSPDHAPAPWVWQRQALIVRAVVDFCRSRAATAYITRVRA